METLGKLFGIVAAAVVAVLGVVALGIGIGFLFAIPLAYLVNYLFSAAFLTFVFGTAKIGYTQAFVLSTLTSWLFKNFTLGYTR